jgi:NAD-dependent DNA ligase
MNSDINKIENIVDLYNKYIEKDYQIITHAILPENLNEEKALNDNLAITINSEIKKLQKKYEYFPLPYITDKMIGERRIIKNNVKVKVKHLVPIKSVDKMQIGEKLSNIFNNINNLLIMPKYDGISCICWYEENKLIFGTKSSDTQGEDITNICSKIINVEKLKLFFKENKEIIGIRGELIIDKDYIPNTTRLAELTGLIRSKKPNIDMFPYLHIIFYFVYVDPNDEQKKSLYDYLTNLKKYNVEITLLFKKPDNIDLINEKIMKILSEQLKVNYDCDGYIFRDNSLDFDSSIAIKKAYYFDAKVDSIEFILGEKSGVYIPKIYIVYNDKTINKNITKVHGYNLNYLFLNKIQINSIITIKYTGDTIAVIDKLNSKGFSKTATFNKYVEYIKSNSSGLEKAIFYENEFIGKIDYLYNFIKKQNIIGGGTAKIKEYLNAIFPDRIDENEKVNIYINYINILKKNKYQAIHGMPEDTIRSFSNIIIALLNNKKKILELTIDALSITSLTYNKFNNFSSHFIIELDNNNRIKDIKQAYKIILNETSKTVLENKQDLIIIYNLFNDF